VLGLDAALQVSKGARNRDVAQAPCPNLRAHAQNQRVHRSHQAGKSSAQSHGEFLKARAQGMHDEEVVSVDNFTHEDQDDQDILFCAS